MNDEAALQVELTASFASRTTDGVKVVLALSDPLPAADSEGLLLQLRSRKQVVRSPLTPSAGAAHGGTTLVTTVPARDLRRGLWRLALVSGSSAPLPVQARLLNQPRQPVALLPGPVPTTRLPHPQPAPQAAAEPAGRVYATAARVVRTGLDALPEKQADRARPLLRRAARALRR